MDSELIIAKPSDGKDHLQSDEAFQDYLFSYYYQGAEWQVSIPAVSETDARERLGRAASGNWDGYLEAKVPAGLGWFVEVWCRFKNWWSRYA